MDAGAPAWQAGRVSQFLRTPLGEAVGFGVAVTVPLLAIGLFVVRDVKFVSLVPPMTLLAGLSFASVQAAQKPRQATTEREVLRSALIASPFSILAFIFGFVAAPRWVAQGWLPQLGEGTLLRGLGGEAIGMDGALEAEIALFDDVEIDIEIRLEPEPAEMVKLRRRLDRTAGMAEQNLRRHRPLAGPARRQASAHGARIVG